MPNQNHDVAGNYYNKYGTNNPVARALVRGFQENLLQLIQQADATDIHEVGCGEGCLTALIANANENLRIRASDQSFDIIDTARRLHGTDRIQFQTRSVYELVAADGADLMLCCEVMEHLDDPNRARNILQKLSARYTIFSVPREPIWRICNIVRGRYLRALGNTPGHIQHWSKREFLAFLVPRFEIVTVRSPFPWTMALCQPHGRIGE